MSSAPGVLAGIVTHHPDPAALLRLVAALAPQVDAILIAANSPCPEDLEAALRAVASPTPLAVRRAPTNEGLGAAHNAAAARARSGGFAFLILFDQDSLPGRDCVSALRARFARLETAGERPAVVGPRPVAPGGEGLKGPGAERAGSVGGRLARVPFVIASGSLIRREALDAVGAFRDDYFIDGIDIEWCLRARTAGYSVWRAEDVPMTHALGRGVIRLPLGLCVADQPPSRVYTAVRNQLAMLRLGHVPAGLKARWLVALPLRMAVHLVRERAGAEIRSALWRGLRDGLLLRLGPPETGPR
ncbi:glycosyltransferase [Methylobacterium sp. JK268]